MQCLNIHFKLGIHSFSASASLNEPANYCYWPSTFWRPIFSHHPS